MNSIQIPKDLVDIVRGIAGLAVGFVTLPVYGYLITHDIKDELRYENRPDMLLYNSNRPTPNHIDFPEGIPEAQRSKHFYHWLKRTFVK